MDRRRLTAAAFFSTVIVVVLGVMVYLQQTANQQTISVFVLKQLEGFSHDEIGVLLGISAGASAPEVLVEEILDAFAQRYCLHVETVSAADEAMFFPLPRPFRGSEAAV